MSGYTEWIRSLIGHRKIPLVSTSAFIRDASGRILWQRRSDFGFWGLPGGVLELNETLTACVIREVHEETGLEVIPNHLVGLYSSPDFDVTYPNGDQIQQVTFCFECQLSGSTPHSHDQETLELAWFDPDKPPATAAWYQAMLADALAGKKATQFKHGNSGMPRQGEPLYKQLRQFVGHAPYIMPSAIALVVDDAGNILLQQRKDNGLWNLPAGGMELGERLDQTAVNETREETGVEVEAEHLLGVYSDPNRITTFSNGDQLNNVLVLFKCRVVGGNPRPDGIESLAAGFFPIDALPKPGHPLLKQVLKIGLSGQDEAYFQ